MVHHNCMYVLLLQDTHLIKYIAHLKSNHYSATNSKRRSAHYPRFQFYSNFKHNGKITSILFLLQFRYIWLFGHGNLKSRVHINLTALILLISQKSQKFLYKKDSYVVDYCISSCLQIFIRLDGNRYTLHNPTYLLPLFEIILWNDTNIHQGT